MNPRFDVFRRLEDNQVQFLGSARTLEEAEALVKAERLSNRISCFVLQSAFGVSFAVMFSTDADALGQ